MKTFKKLFEKFEANDTVFAPRDPLTDSHPMSVNGQLQRGSEHHDFFTGLGLTKGKSKYKYGVDYDFDGQTMQHKYSFPKEMPHVMVSRAHQKIDDYLKSSGYAKHGEDGEEDPEVAHGLISRAPFSRWSRHSDNDDPDLDPHGDVVEITREGVFHRKHFE